MSTDDQNPYAASQAPAGPAPTSSIGKAIAIACLVVACVLSLPIAFFFSCLGGLATASTIAGNNNPNNDFIGMSGLTCGFLGVGLTVWGFVWLIIKVTRSGSRQPILPYDRPREFGNAPPFPAAEVRGANPFATPGENPFSDRSPS
jgi:hypothetical protein